MFERLDASELAVGTEELARGLIGVVLVRDSVDGRSAGRIVETEAYVIGDPASHAYMGPRQRNATMFLEPFLSYVYLIYGTSFCFNVTSEPRGEGAGVLVRALEPLDGIELMERRRRSDSLRDLCRGPGRLTQALDIDRSLDGRSLLTDPDLWLARAPRARGPIGVSRRIGITRAAHRRLRFYERGNPFVSGPRTLSPP
ncbi:MAG: DNA-3-methyladenine glycosylase [Candidatus Eremiobacteraeota bacterium]|nr:DNA-3-methyladenine glycosylase [Candidatus Eremiobacteraeota bacterium]